MIFILILIIIAFIVYLWKNRIVLRVDTLFRKGFSKDHDNYRSLLLHWEAGRPGKLIPSSIL